MRRADCLRSIYDDIAGCAVVTIMGAVAAELYALGHRPSFFYLEHAMGLASFVGPGVVLAQPDRHVVVLDGDGSVLMNFGTFTTLARYRPRNLTHVVFDNESLLSVGGFPTATATARISRGSRGRQECHVCPPWTHSPPRCAMPWWTRPSRASWRRSSRRVP